MSRINKTPEAGKKTRESRTPKSNPKIILMLSTNGRIFAFTTSASAVLHGSLRMNLATLMGLPGKVKNFTRSGRKCEI